MVMVDEMKDAFKGSEPNEEKTGAEKTTVLKILKQDLFYNPVIFPISIDRLAKLKI